MTSSDIIKRARALADLSNSDFITYEDEISSLYESWKDIYSKITDSSDDYFISSIVINTAGNTTQLGDSEWELTIPQDIYKIRFVNYMDNGKWFAMDKFNTNQRNRQLAAPRYRWRGNKLWIVSSSFSGLPSQIRIDYYPAPVKPSLPEADYIYGTSIPTYNKNLVESPYFTRIKNSTYTEDIDYFFYVYAGDIFVESQLLKSKIALWTTGTAPSNLVYNLGWLYWIDGDNIWRASIDFSTTLVPVQLTTSNDVESFTITNGKIYFSTTIDTRSIDFDGSGNVQVYAYPVSDLYYIGNDIYYISSGIIYKNTVSTTISAVKMFSDGSFIYYLDSAGVLHKYLVSDDILYLNVHTIGGGCQDWIAIITDNLDILSISTMEDTDFVYPVNEANEIMAYQSAIDYKRKQSADTTALVARLAEIWDRFMDVLKRDEGQPERRVAEAPRYYY